MLTRDEIEAALSNQPYPTFEAALRMALALLDITEIVRADGDVVEQVRLLKRHLAAAELAKSAYSKTLDAHTQYIQQLEVRFVEAKMLIDEMIGCMDPAKERTQEFTLARNGLDVPPEAPPRPTGKQYARRDLPALDRAGGYYSRHVGAMTIEQLHSKSEIAAELGWRDQCLAAAKELCDDLFSYARVEWGWKHGARWDSEYMEAFGEPFLEPAAAKEQT